MRTSSTRVQILEDGKSGGSGSKHSFRKAGSVASNQIEPGSSETTINDGNSSFDDGEYDEEKAKRAEEEELDPKIPIYLKKHQKIAILMLIVSGVVLLTGSLFLQDWRQRAKDCHTHQENWAPPVIELGWTHQCSYAKLLDYWVFTSSFAILAALIQIITFLFALYRRLLLWCVCQIIAFLIGGVAFALAHAWGVYWIEIPGIQNIIQPGVQRYRLRASIFYGSLLLDLLLTPIATGLFYRFTKQIRLL